MCFLETDIGWTFSAWQTVCASNPGTILPQSSF